MACALRSVSMLRATMVTRAPAGPSASAAQTRRLRRTERHELAGQAQAQALAAAGDEHVPVNVHVRMRRVNARVRARGHRAASVPVAHVAPELGRAHASEENDRQLRVYACTRGECTGTLVWFGESACLLEHEGGADGDANQRRSAKTC
jgi:hypothetical protein